MMKLVRTMLVSLALSALILGTLFITLANCGGDVSNNEVPGIIMIAQQSRSDANDGACRAELSECAPQGDLACYSCICKGCHPFFPWCIYACWGQWLSIKNQISEVSFPIEYIPIPENICKECIEHRGTTSATMTGARVAFCSGEEAWFEATP